MKRVGNIIFALILLASVTTSAQDAKFLPPEGKQLLIIGQDMGAVGGFAAPNNNGYYENVSTKPGGLTTYSNFPQLMGLHTAVNWGSGDLHAQAIVENPKYRNSVIAIGLYMVDQERATAAGKNDGDIIRLGQWIKNANRPVFLRIGYEFDGNWNHYDPESYKKAFIRFWTIFDSMKVTNVATVWQACTSPVDDKIEGKHENIEDWYPGDKYVDWVGYSWFINTPKQVELTDEVCNFARRHKKPVMVAESASQGYDITQRTKKNIGEILDGPSGQGMKNKKPDVIWSEWFQPYFDYIEKNKDVVKIVAYINCNWDAQQLWGPPYSQGYWGDTRVEGNKKIKTKWLETISKPNWLHASPQLFQQLGFQRSTARGGYGR